MADEVVLDASVAVKCFITEPASDAARALAGSGGRLIAPQFVHVEIASVTVKRAKRGDIDRAFAEDIVAATGELFDEVFAAEHLVASAQRLALDHGLSVYDALYAALAMERNVPLATADQKLAARLEGVPQAPKIIKI